MTYGSTADAQDAIENMDMNEMQGRVLKVNLARPMKNPLQLGGNRAGEHVLYLSIASSNNKPSMGLGRLAERARQAPC